LFGIKESGKNVKGKMHLYFLNDINTPTLKIDVIFFLVGVILYKVTYINKKLIINFIYSSVLYINYL
jgi:hypothetical protein